MSPTLKSTEVGDFGVQSWGVPLGADLIVMLELQRANIPSATPRRTNGEIIFEEFQPMWCDHNSTTSQTDGQTDDMRSQYALCTKVHRAVKKIPERYLVEPVPRSRFYVSFKFLSMDAIFTSFSFDNFWNRLYWEGSVEFSWLKGLHEMRSC